MNSRRFASKSLVAALSLLIATGCAKEPDKVAPPTAESMPGTEPGQVRDDNGLKMTLVWCPPGKFTMGSPESEAGPSDDVDQVEVTLTRGFWLGKCEVTQSEWTQVMTTRPWKGQHTTKVGDNFPATFVSWDDALEFCRKHTERESQAGRVPKGWEYTLPTEAQWERACRAGTEARFSFGDDESKLSEFAWFDENARQSAEKYAHRVGQKKPNPWGLYDMHGNITEWCSDYWYGDKLLGGRDPQVIEPSSLRAIRGGGWGSTAGYCRSSFHAGGRPSDRGSERGFRVALSPNGNK